MRYYDFGKKDESYYKSREKYTVKKSSPRDYQTNVCIHIRIYMYKVYARSPSIYSNCHGIILIAFFVHGCVL